MRQGAIILAGGQGSRFQGKKQFELVGGKQMWELVRDKALEVFPSDAIVSVGIDIEAGASRSASVMNGLSYFDGSLDRITILEAARPLVTVGQIRRLADNGSPSVTYALPLVNTPIGRDGSYFNREDFYDLLTPQAFDYRMLWDAYRTGKYADTTDETVVIYREYGIRPEFIIEGENLIKVTYRRDLAVINALLGGTGGHE